MGRLAPSSPLPISPAGSGRARLVTVKALQLALSSGEEMGYNEWDGDHFLTTAKCSTVAYEEAGITNPRQEISMMEVHDCFSITELVTMEDLHISERGGAVSDILDGFFDLDGGIPCQPDGGLKCFGHPIGASGLRMLYEMYLQLLGRAGERQTRQSALRADPQPGRHAVHEHQQRHHRRPIRRFGFPGMTAVEYTHLPLHQEITAIGGTYTLVKEARIAHRGREVLYLVGHAVFDATCCGVGGCAYGLVPGIVLGWKHSQTADGLAVSQVKPVRDLAVQQEIRRVIMDREVVPQVSFQ